MKPKQKFTVLRDEKEDSPEFLKIDNFLIDIPAEEKVDLKNIVLRDTSEKLGHGWWFGPDDIVETTEKANLFTGDYTLRGYEQDFIIERKGSTSEFSMNIFEKRFEDEMIRLDEFKWSFIVCEFTFEDLLSFPVNSGIPPRFWKKLKVNSSYLISAFLRYQVRYKTKIILAGEQAQVIATKLFKIVSMQ